MTKYIPWFVGFVALMLLVWFLKPQPDIIDKTTVIRDTVLLFKQLPPDTVIKQKIVYFYRRDTVFVSPDSLGYPQQTEDSLYKIPAFVLLDTLATKRKDSIFYKFYFPEMERSYVIKYGIDTNYLVRDSIILIRKEPMITWEKIGIFALGLVIGVILGR